MCGWHWQSKFMAAAMGGPEGALMSGLPHPCAGHATRTKLIVTHRVCLPRLATSTSSPGGDVYVYFDNDAQWCAAAYYSAHHH